MPRCSCLAVSLLLLAFALGGCATRKETAAPSESTAAPRPSTDTGEFEKTALTGPRGGTLMLADIGSGAKTFNILVATETSSTSIVGPMFDGLVTRDADTLAIKPALAR